MNNYCPRCFALVPQQICPHCGTDMEQIKKLRTLEKLAEQRHTSATLQEVIRFYQQFDRPAAVGRVLGQLADHALGQGQWGLAHQTYLELLALGESIGSPDFWRQIKRRLGLLIGRRGELPLAHHLLGQTEASGDPYAVVDQLRLDMDERAKAQILQRVDKLAGFTDPETQAWIWEARIRFTNIPKPDGLKLLLANAPAESLSLALASRAWGLWLVGHQQPHTALEHLTSALTIFESLSDPYEQARTLLDLARASLLAALIGSPTVRFLETRSKNDDAFLNQAHRYLGMALSLFRRLGAILMEQQAAELATALQWGYHNRVLKSAPAPEAAGLPQPCGLIWLAMNGNWDEAIWAQAKELVYRQGGWSEKLMGGLVAILPHQQWNITIETGLALHELLSSLPPHPRRRFRLTLGLGTLDLPPHQWAQNAQRLLQQAAFHHLRQPKAKHGAGQLWVSQALYLHTQSDYRFDAIPQVTAWMQLATPQAVAPQVSPLRRTQLGLEMPSFKQLEPMLEGFKLRQKGGVIGIEGLAGTGKTRILEWLIDDLKSGQKKWLIHLRAREVTPHEPFGAIRHWLGEDFVPPISTSEERHLSHLATFRRSVLGLLNSRPLILAVDDVHLLDSGSLSALRAILPLTVSYPLAMLLSARPFQPEMVEAPAAAQHWRDLIEVATRALVDDCRVVQLPDDRAYQAPTLPQDSELRHVLVCAAVLGERFTPLVLRRMTRSSQVVRHLRTLQGMGWLSPDEQSPYWRFAQTAARDSIYSQLLPDYRALLHWEARQALKYFGLGADDHIHPSGLSDPALAISMRRAQAALQLDAPYEALLHFNRALQHYQGQETLLGLSMGKITALLSLGDLTAAQSLLDELRQLPDLSIHDEAQLLLLQGEIYYRAGEVAPLFRIYEQAALKLRQSPEADLSEQISLIYAQALARFKRNELEMARSMIGGALLLAQGAGLDDELADFWELIAQIHHQRGEIEPAKAAIQKALTSHRSAGTHWLLVRPLQHYGRLLLESGDLEQAYQPLKDALELAEGIGNGPSISTLHHLLGKIALYRGEFGRLTAHLQAALRVTLFAETTPEIALARAAFADGLTLEGRLVHALQQATLALHLAEQSHDRLAITTAQLSIARVTLALNCPDDAELALKQAQLHIQTSNVENALYFDLALVRMQWAMQQQEKEVFNQAWDSTRRLSLPPSDYLLRGRRGLLAGQFKATLGEWNDSAREFERAALIFIKLGAVYWTRLAKAQLQKIAPNAPGYDNEGRYYLRGDSAPNDEGQDRPTEQLSPTERRRQRPTPS